MPDNDFIAHLLKIYLKNEKKQDPDNIVVHF